MFEPTNEQGVIILFAQMAEEVGIEFVKVGTAFPDATIRWNDKIYRVEFEYESKNFLIHRHDVRNCDIVICWTSDLPDDFPLPIIEIHTRVLPEHAPDLAAKTIKELSYWKFRARIAEAKLKQSPEFAALTGATTREQATAILTERPGISGSELGRALEKMRAWGDG